MTDTTTTMTHELLSNIFTEEFFEEDENELINFNELEVNKVYKIKDYEWVAKKQNNQFKYDDERDRLILHLLCDPAGDKSIRVWATSSVQNELEDDYSYELPLFIKFQGEKETFLGNTFYKFKIYKPKKDLV